MIYSSSSTKVVHFSAGSRNQPFLQIVKITLLILLKTVRQGRKKHLSKFQLSKCEGPLKKYSTRERVANCKMATLKSVPLRVAFFRTFMAYKFPASASVNLRTKNT